MSIRLVTWAAGIVAIVAAVTSIVLGLTQRLGWALSLNNVIGLVYVSVALVGGAMVRASSRNRVGWAFLISGVCLPLGNLLSEAANPHGLAVPTPGWIAAASAAVSVPGVFLVGMLGVLWFPDGDRGGRRRRLLAVACQIELVGLLLWVLFSDPLASDERVKNTLAPGGWITGTADVLGICILFVAPLTGLTTWSLFRRARRSDNERSRKALFVTAWCAAAIPASFVLCVGLSFAGINPNNATVVENTGALTVGIAAWIGISRYGLLDIRAVVGHVVVYAAISALVTAVYLVVAAVLVSWLGGSAPQVIATVVAVLAALPARNGVQSLVNRRIYGLRDDPARALALLGARLNATASPDDILLATASTLADVLRLRFVGISADDLLLASAGTADAPGIRLPLLIGGEVVGELRVCARQAERDAALSREPLLLAVVPQIAVAVRAARLAHDLAGSRESLVLAREDERRRLRRELHDGVGPTLAAVGLGLDAATRAVEHGNMHGAVSTLAEVRHETDSALQSIRRIAYDLRPPILDEIGLAAALREHAARLDARTCITPATLPPLPAAVEVAAYRIAVEAMTNSVRHAPGAAIFLSLSVNGSLELAVADDGGGLGDGFRAGVGITSMRERASEVGGSCVVSSTLPRGTAVRVMLPLPTP